MGRKTKLSIRETEEWFIKKMLSMTLQSIEQIVKPVLIDGDTWTGRSGKTMKVVEVPTKRQSICHYTVDYGNKRAWIEAGEDKEIIRHKLKALFE